jgi:hypothetical protein
MTEIDFYILLGKGLYQNSELDWFAQARCDKAIKLMTYSPSAKLIITGGRNISDVSEASVMANYITSKNPQIKDRIILEEEGLSTIHQLVLVKKKLLIPDKVNGVEIVNRLVNIGLITDETHLSRAMLTADHLLGDEYKVTGFGATLRISGYARKAIETYENKMYELTKRNPVLLYCKKGDHEAWFKFDEFLRATKKEKHTDGQAVDVTEEYTKILKAELNI